MTFREKLLALRMRREEISRMIEQASKADLSYEQNHDRLANLDRDLGNIEEEIRELENPDND